MMERATYHSEDARWYKFGDEPWRVEFVKPGAALREKPSVVADTYGDAFLALYGHAAPILENPRTHRPSVFA